MTTITFCGSGPLDEYEEMEECIENEYGFENEVASRGDLSDAEVAVKIVGKWVLRHSFTQFVDHEDSLRIVSGCEAAGLAKDTPYLTETFWNEKFQGMYAADFWDDLFKDRKYINESNGISAFIPDDKIERMVLYFLRKWKSRLYSYIADDQVPEEHKLAVLKKQVENFAFINRKVSFGNQWKMFSEPNEMLLKALEAGGSVVLPGGIAGPTFTVEAHSSLPKSAGEGPTPDDTDRKIYHDILSYAKSKVGRDNVHDTWSMVKASFKNEEGVDVRCYAFSGHRDTSRELYKMPQQWFKERSAPDAFGDEMEVEVRNVDCEQLGQNMVQAVFRALKSDIKEDLDKLTTHTAFEEKESAVALIQHARKDIASMDYGLYYDLVINEMNCYDDRLFRDILEFVKNKMKGLVDAKTVVDDIRCLVSVGGKNKSFSPKVNELNKYLLQKFNNNQEKAQETLDFLVKISKKHAGELKKVLDSLPDEFLSEFEEQLMKARCGEDNVVALVVQKVFSQYVNSLFFKPKVEFVALDSKKLEGKPFCSVCGCKVRFYSILPFLLRFIGHTGSNFDKITTLFSKLN